jgi:hypothetical protein
MTGGNIGGALDHDHIGAHVGQHHAGERAWAYASEFNHAQAVQRPAGWRCRGGGFGGR